MENVIVFDLGGTLLEFEGMPLSWIPWYSKGFAAVNDAFSLGLRQEDLERSVQVLKEYNPRIRPREEEIPPEKIFGDAVRHWENAPPVEQVIEQFFQGLELSPKVYGDTVPALSRLKKLGYRTACLTNLPSGMPDGLFQRQAQSLVNRLDYYLSSGLCGFRKPSRVGLDHIAAHFHVPVERLIFVGDEPLDGETARRAGCRFFLIRRGEGGPSQGDFQVITGLEELASLAEGGKLFDFTSLK